jgi:hypothetical protein
MAQNIDFEWAKTFEGDGFAEVYSVCFDESGNVYTVGNFSETVDFDPGVNTHNLTPDAGDGVFIFKLSPTSTQVGIDNSGLIVDNLKLYPNPTTGNLTIDLSDLNKVNVSIIDSVGNEVFSATNVTQNTLEVSLTEFSEGIYFVKVQ